MGLREGEILRQVELPLALPVIVGGVRTSAVQVVATVTLGAILGYGGLGRYLIDGIARREYDRLWAGVVLIALLSIATELALALLERRLDIAGPTGRARCDLTGGGRGLTGPGARACYCCARRRRGRRAPINARRFRPMRPFRKLALGASMLALAISACSTGGGSSPSAAAGGAAIKIGSEGFYESGLMAEIYAQVLEANGYKVERNLGLGARAVTSASIESGADRHAARVPRLRDACTTTRPAATPDPETNRRTSRTSCRARAAGITRPRVHAGPGLERVRRPVGHRVAVQPLEDQRSDADRGPAQLGPAARMRDQRRLRRRAQGPVRDRLRGAQGHATSPPATPRSRRRSTPRRSTSRSCARRSRRSRSSGSRSSRTTRRRSPRRTSRRSSATTSSRRSTRPRSASCSTTCPPR